MPNTLTQACRYNPMMYPPPWLHPRAAYIHVPFCAHHCGYCDFAVVAGRDDFTPAYVDALIRELATLDEPHPVETIFIGGGTPTYLPPAELRRLLAAVRKWLPMSPESGEPGCVSARSLDATNTGRLRNPAHRSEECEWSIESTPDSLDAERVGILADAGVTRVSIGIQSFNPGMLQALDRRHRVEEIVPAIERVRSRIRSMSLDLIFGVPGQTLVDWKRDLETAVALQPDHLSCYGLTYERGTPMWRDRQAGQVKALDEEIEREMFLFAHDELPKHGYEHYEISNYAKPSQHCRHNEVYWANHAYLGFGLGAARYVNGRRELNTRSLTDYIARIAAGRSAVIQSEVLDPEERARETLTTQLRRREGVSRAEFAEQTGIALDALAGRAIARLAEIGLLTEDGDRISLTREGLCVADAVLTELWADDVAQLAQINSERIPLG
ncbi:MAG: radical SAM family heme chaperone HemW [Gemmataceae bacterium]